VLELLQQRLLVLVANAWMGGAGSNDERVAHAEKIHTR
jgi:hypothetical protein